MQLDFFKKMSISHGFLNKKSKKLQIISDFLKAGCPSFNAQLYICFGEWRICLKAGDLASLSTEFLSGYNELVHFAR